MIWKVAFLAVAAINLATAEPSKLSDNFALVQKTVYDLLWHVDQPDKVHPEIYKLGTSWDIEANIDLYTNKAQVTEFLQRYHYGMLPRGRIFSIYYPHLLEEAQALFNIFYHARDVQTFLNTAAWARVHMNEGLFIYAFNIAILHRPDTVKLRLPLPYEMAPNFYFDADIIQQAYDYKMSLNPHDSIASPRTFFAQVNDTRSITITRDPESRLAYYREDIDLNAYYFYYNLAMPFWMSAEEYKFPTENRGELYYYIHKLLYNRYNLERLSHGMGEVEDFDWDRPIMTGFNPSIRYHNGFGFPQRNHWTSVPVRNYRFLEWAKEFESRITATIDHGHIVTGDGKTENIYDRKGFNMIGNIIEGNNDSINSNFYGSIDHSARAVFAFSTEPHNKYQILPGTLEHLSTSMRDPAFYRIYKRILSYFGRYKKHLPAYTADELSFRGVEIESVAIDRMSTFFDWTDALISNSVKVHDHQDAESILIKARQHRLNHNTFTYHMTIKSERETRASVRIFVGPKFNVHGKEMDISENFDRFYQIDYFVTDLTSGTNKIERKSSDAAYTIPDYESSDVFYKRVLAAVKNNTVLPIPKKFVGFPDRLVLPRGTEQGFPVQFFFYVNEFVADSSHRIRSRLLGEWIEDNKPLGFPLDRRVYGYNFTSPNMLFKDAFIYHKEKADFHLTV